MSELLGSQGRYGRRRTTTLPSGECGGRLCHKADHAIWHDEKHKNVRRSGTAKAGDRRRCGIEGLRERKRARTRAGAVDAALDLFVRRGYDNVTVADICEAAEISPRSFFRYFTGKEDVLSEPVREMAARTEAVLDGAPESLGGREVLRLVFLEAGRYAIENRAKMDAFRTVIRGTPRSLSQSVLLPEHELKLATRLARRSGAIEPDLRLRLLVATSGAVFRVWRETLETETLETEGAPDPLESLGEMLDAVSISAPTH